MKTHLFFRHPTCRASLVALASLLIALVSGFEAGAVGTWASLNNRAPAKIRMMLLLSDGTVMAQSDSDGVTWYRLTPDSSGSYLNGSWTTLAAMSYSRLYYSSAVLQDGRVFVAGAEYGTGATNGEVFDPIGNSWTTVNVPSGLINTTPSTGTGGNNTYGFSDSGAKILSDGRVLISPVYPLTGNGSVIFDPVSMSFSSAAASIYYQNEASWVKLPDDSILTVGRNSTTSERYIPSLGTWILDGNLPAQIYGSGSETGPAVLLPNGKAFFIGGNGNTALYTPTGNTNKGTWAAGPVIPNSQCAPDAPAAVLVNGRVLCAVSPTDPTGTNTFTTPTSFYEYDPSANNFTRLSGPRGLTQNMPSYLINFLALPDGNVLYCDRDSQLYLYQPDGTPLASPKPAIYGLTPNPDGSFHLTGTQFNGINEGAAYGDDAQMDSNYPLVRLGSGGNVTYGRTFNWSSTGVATGGNVVSTEFTVTPYLSPGWYSLSVVANGIGSDPVSFYGPVWVDFNYGGPFFLGMYLFPYNTLAAGVSAVDSYGTIFFRSSGHTPETLTISKPVTLVAHGGPVTLGQ